MSLDNSQYVSAQEDAPLPGIRAPTLRVEVVYAVAKGKTESRGPMPIMMSRPQLANRGFQAMQRMRMRRGCLGGHQPVVCGVWLMGYGGVRGACRRLQDKQANPGSAPWKANLANLSAWVMKIEETV